MVCPSIADWSKTKVFFYYVATEANHQKDKCSTTTIILCGLSGVAFVLLCVSWCWTITATQCLGRPATCQNFYRRSNMDDTTNYTTISCLFWMAAIFFMCLATGHLVNYFDGSNQNCRVPPVTSYIDSLDYVVLLAMWSLVGTFMCCNVLSYCVCIRQHAGHVFN